MTRGVPLWAFLVAGVVLAVGVLFFFQYKDPMVLIFAVIAGAMVLFVGLATHILRSGGLAVVKVRCRACGALSAETSRFCSQCGQPL